MSVTDLERELEALSAALRERPETLGEPEFRRVYELTGRLMRERHGAGSTVNHCSVEGVSATLLRMARSITPCRLLDVGMGGYPFIDIELERRGFDVTGIEYSHSLTHLAREVARGRGTAVTCLVADGTRLPFRDGAFEACLCSETLEHIPDDAAVVREIHRVLRPGGVLLLTVPCILGLLGLATRARQALRRRPVILHPTHLREYTYFSARRLVASRFAIERWYAVPFVMGRLRDMPYERALSLLVSLPGLKHFSQSIAFVLRRLDPEVSCGS